MNFLTPAEVAAAVCSAGKAKTELPLARLMLLGVLAGVYVGFGANVATRIGSTPDAETAVGVFLFAAVFTVGLMLVVIAGAELFTGNNMACVVAVLNGQATWGGLLYNWAVVYLANLLGSLLLVYLIFAGMYWASLDAASGSVALSGMGIKAVAIAKAKLGLSWNSAFVRGILCNWLVCLAVWLSYAAKDVIGKIFAVFFPIMAFVASGFEHCVANMFYIPMGIAIARQVPAAVASQLSVPGGNVMDYFSYAHFLTANLIPVTLGNIIGGAVFVGGFYWLAYLRK